MSENQMVIVQLHAEHGTREHRSDGAFKLDRLLLIVLGMTARWGWRIRAAVVSILNHEKSRTEGLQGRNKVPLIRLFTTTNLDLAIDRAI